MVLRHAQGLGVLQHHGAAEGLPRVVSSRCCEHAASHLLTIPLYSRGNTPAGRQCTALENTPRTAVLCRARRSHGKLTTGGLVCTQEDVLLYGGEGAGDLRPEFVPKLNWLLATDFMPGFAGTVRHAPVDVFSDPLLGVRRLCWSFTLDDSLARVAPPERASIMMLPAIRTERWPHVDANGGDSAIRTP